MFTLLLWLAVSLVLLSVGAELLVRGAIVLARRLRISPFFIGLTIVGFGTSTPELFTSLIAAELAADDIAVGNVVGSNVFNIAFILGVTSLLLPIPVRFAEARPQILWALVSALALFATFGTNGQLTPLMGASFLVALALYVGLGYRAGRRARVEEGAIEVQRAVGLDGAGWPAGLLVSWAFVAIGLVLLVQGADLLVESASGLARLLGISELAIGLTIVASGTSVPELFTSLVATVRRQPEISLGNILGSNIFNVLGILGLTSLLWPQTVNPQVLRLDVPLMVALTAALIPILRSGSRIARGEGGLLLVVYLAYLWVLFT